MRAKGRRSSGAAGTLSDVESPVRYKRWADDLNVQRVLRHSKVIVTREHYIKLRDPKVDAAMGALARAISKEKERARSAAVSEIAETRVNKERARSSNG